MLTLDCGNSALKCQANNDTTTFYLDKPYFEQQLSDYILSFDRNTPVVLSSVTSLPIEDTIIKTLNNHFANPPIIATVEAVFKSLKNGYKNTTQLGVDRWLSMIATLDVPSNKIIIDAGSWIKMDAVLESGQHLGGAIISKTTADKKKLLDRFNLDDDNQNTELVFGASTKDCIFLAKDHYGVKAVIATLSAWLQHMSQPCTIIISGGDADTIVHLLKTLAPNLQTLILDIQQNKNLVLSGLSARYS